MSSKEKKVGVDIIGFGPIGRDLGKKLCAIEKYSIASISDSSLTVYPKDSAQVERAIEWKSEGRKFSDLKELKQSRARETLQGLEYSGARVAVDVTNSDYAKPEEAKKRALLAIGSGKHYVSANKVALSNYFGEIFDAAKKKNLKVGYGATVRGARHAIRIAQSLERREVQSAFAVLNASTTFILSKLEENSSMSFEEACNEASKTGILESDWGIDLDGVDAAAKTAILSNVLVPERRLAIREVKRRGIRDPEARELIESMKGSHESRIRLVSEIDQKGNASVKPKSMPLDSPLAVQGRYNVVMLVTTNLGDISVRNLGGGISLTSSVLLSDIKEILGP